MVFNRHPRPPRFHEGLNWALRYTPGVIQTKDHGLLAGWDITGIDTESLDEAIIANALSHLARGFGAFGDDDVFWITMIRRPADVNTLRPDGIIPPALQVIEEERRLLIESEGEIYENRLCLFYMRRRMFETYEPHNLIRFFEDQCETVEARLESVLSLKRMWITEREVHGETVRFNDLMSALMTMLHGKPRRLRNFDSCPILFFNDLFALNWRQEHRYSRATLDDRAFEILTIRSLPEQMLRSALEALEEIDCEFIWTTRYAPMSRHRARRYINNVRREWLQAGRSLASFTSDQSQSHDPYTLAMAAAADQALFDLNRDDIQYGQYVTTFSFFGKEDAEDGGRKGVDEAVKRLRRVMNDIGFEMRLERENMWQAYRGSLPGHPHRNPHEMLMSNQGLVDLLPTRTLWRGEKTNPCPLFPAESPPLLVGRGQTGEEFYFNLHHQDVGHTLVFGQTGGGKSVLLGLIAAEYLKYGGQVFFFDKGASSRYICEALGGRFFDLGKGELGSLGPLQDAHRLGADWLRNWLTALTEKEVKDGTGTDWGDIRKDLDQVVAGLMASSRPSMADAVTHSQGEHTRPIFVRYAASKSILSDRPASHLGMSHFNVFEMGQVSSDYSLDEAALVMDYLAAMISAQLDGRPSLIVIDEAWSFIAHPVFQKRLKSWLKEARKSNCAIVLATQSLADVGQNDLTPVLLESCPTKIFLPNQAALAAEQRDQYARLGISDKQIALIASLTPKRDYYIVQPQGQRVVDFRMGPSTLSLIARTSEEDSKRVAGRAADDPDFWMRDLEAQWSGGRGETRPKASMEPMQMTEPAKGTADDLDTDVSSGGADVAQTEQPLSVTAAAKVPSPSLKERKAPKPADFKWVSVEEDPLMRHIMKILNKPAKPRSKPKGDSDDT